MDLKGKNVLVIGTGLSGIGAVHLLHHLGAATVLLEQNEKAQADAIRDKLDKLDKFFSPDTKVHVTLSVDKDRHKIEVTIPIKGSIIRSEQVSNDMYVSIDLVEEVIERQIKKYKGKIIRKHQEGANLNRSFIERMEPEEETVRIVRHKQFEFKPMYPEDACVQMELLGHNFYVFVNAETEGVAVVYKRKGGTYGLIEPEA